MPEWERQSDRQLAVGIEREWCLRLHISCPGIVVSHVAELNGLVTAFHSPYTANQRPRIPGSGAQNRGKFGRVAEVAVLLVVRWAVKPLARAWSLVVLGPGYSTLVYSTRANKSQGEAWRPRESL